MRLNRTTSLLLRLPLLLLAAGVLHGAVLVTLSTSAVTLSGGGVATLTALCTATSGSLAVTWSFSPQIGTLGAGNTVNSAGTSVNNYAAPATITTRQTVTITATSVQDPTKSYSVSIQLNPASITVTPSTVTLAPGASQQFSATGGGAGYIWRISPQTGAIDQTGLYTAPATVTSVTTVTVTATSDVDSTVSGTARISLTATPTTTVTISPTTASLGPGQTQQFTAAIAGVPGTAATINWSITPLTGAIDTNGLYTAPTAVTVTAKVTVTATSTADGSKSASATVTLSPVLDVGTGVTGTLQNAFINSFFRGGFNYLVSLPPIAAVKRLGTTGYVQEFNDALKTSGVKLALATASSSAPTSTDGTTTTVVQLLADLYGHYSTVGASVAGLPLYDTLNCPPIDATNSCTYDIFDKSYALFAYHAALTAGQNFTIRNLSGSTSILFYTAWTAGGGITGLGRPVDVETAVTGLIVAPATTATTATMQAFANGAIYSITSGLNKNTLFTVTQPIYGLYVTNNGPAGSLGLPVTQEIVLSNGDHRQTFEGGVLQYTPGGTGPVIRPPVSRVQLSGASVASTLTLNLGQTLNLTAQPIGSGGEALTDRPVSWSTTNSRVLTITVTANGAAVVKAVGGGAASITAASEGIASPKLNVIVIAPCCQVGDGAPPAVQQSFQDALTRNRISVQIPIPSPATRVGNGYVQMVQSADASAATWYLAQSDKIGTAYVVGGATLVAWQAMGGAGGTLGYPVTDLSAGGTQRFENSAALAGNPVRLVSGGVLTKWGLLAYETGAAGAPVSDPSAFATFGANSGVTQSFSGGAIFNATAGPRSGQSWFVTGLILARYNALGGPGGDFGMPTSDEFVTAGVHQQNFEGGNITWSAGDTVAKEHAAAKTPGLIVSPSTLSAGSRARLAIVGFPSNSTIRVSLTGQPDFTVTTANGAYTWDMFIPLSTKSGAVAVHAADTKGTSAADGTLTVRGFNDNRVPLVKVQGDNQTGPPGALLPMALRIALLDASGDPVVGAAVTFEASSGAQLTTAAAVTDANGQAQTQVRLQSAEGVTLVRADASGVASTSVTFGLRSAASSLANFPKLSQTGDIKLGAGPATIAQKGALLTAVAGILRYHQNRGELAAPNGLADPSALNQFLTALCPTDSKGAQLCDGFLAPPGGGEQVVNLWRAAEFTGGADVEVAPATTAATTTAIADFLAQGSPVLLSLALSLNGAPAGGHFVVATGIAADGSLAIQDPSPLFARTALADYLNGFTLAGGVWKAELRSAARFALGSPLSTRFLLTALSQSTAVLSSLAAGISSPAGSCGLPFDLVDSVDAAGNPPAGSPLLSRFTACDGAQVAYQLQIGGGQAFRAQLTDLAPGGSATDLSGSAPATWQLSRPQFYLALAPQTASFTAAAVVNGATFVSGIAPGGVASIFGTGLSGNGKTTTVDMDGVPMRLIFATPFQINAEVPLTMAPGVHTLTVQSVFGSAQQSVTVSAVAPGIFLIGNPPVGAITNQNFSLVGTSNPVARGQSMVIFATGLGAVTQSGSYLTTNTPVTVVLNGTELPASFAGRGADWVGWYQVNVTIPTGAAPGLSLPLTLKVGGQQSNSVLVALQ